MKAAPFEYHRPQTRSELVAALSGLDNAKLLAGGQSLVPMLNMRYVIPDHLIDLNCVPDLAGISISNDGQVVIGAMTRQAELLRNPQVREHLPILIEALGHVGHVQTRARGTIGGSLCHLDPAAELPLVAALLDADLVVQGPAGERTVSIHDWPLGYMTPNLEPAELLVAVRVAPWPPGHGYAFMEYARRHGDFAIVSCGVLIEVSAGRISRAALGFGGFGENVQRLEETESNLIGLDRAMAVDLAAASAIRLECVRDAYYSAEYRRHLAATLASRAMARAFDRAREQGAVAA